MNYLKLILPACLAVVGCSDNPLKDKDLPVPETSIITNSIPAPPSMITIPDVITDPLASVAPPQVSERDYAYTPYTEDNYPELYQAWGSDWMSDINAMMPLVVDMVVDEDLCGEIASVDLSEAKSKPMQHATFLVTCSDKTHFYIKDKDIPAISQPRAS